MKLSNAVAVGVTALLAIAYVAKTYKALKAALDDG